MESRTSAHSGGRSAISERDNASGQTTLRDDNGGVAFMKKETLGMKYFINHVLAYFQKIII